MKKALFSLSCILGLSTNIVYADQQYSDEQLTKIVQEDFKQLQQTATSKKIVGEQIDIQLPKHMQLAFMVGNGKDRFMAEYVSKKENVEQWKTDFIGQQRSKIPLNILAYLSIEGITQACPSPYLTSMTQTLKNDPSRIVFSYFCKLPQATAPFGEGGVMTFLKGQEYIFKFWKAWRPQSEKDFVEFTNIQADTGKSQKLNIGLSPEKYMNFVSDAFSVRLCNPQAKKPCDKK